VQDLGVFVEAFADAMSTVFTDDREIVRFGMLLDNMPDITQVGAWPYQLDTQFHAFMGNLADTFCANRWLTDVKHFAGIAVITIFYDGDIDIDDIAFLQFLLTGDAVAYLVVNRSADRFRKTVIIQRRRDGLLHVDDVVMANLVQLIGGYAGFYMGSNHLKYFASQSAGYPHFFYFL
jgi:hypothetical protein